MYLIFKPSAILLFFLNLIFFSTFSSSDPIALKNRNLVFQKVSLDQYGSAFQPNVMFQDSIGFVWIGTPEAIFRYDGFQATEFNTPAGASILAINELRGQLVVGSTQGLFTVARDSFQLIPIKSDKLQDPVVVSMVRSNDGALWIGSRKGIAIMTDFEEMTPIVTTTDVKTVDSMAIYGNYVLAATRDGLHAFSQRTKKQVSIESVFPKLADKAFTKKAFYTIYITSGGQVWLGTQSNGVYHFDQNSLSATHLTSENSGIASNYVWGITSDKDGQIWLSSRMNGLSILVDGKPPAINFKHSDILPHSLADDATVNFLNDRLGNIWIGLGKSISLYHQWQNILHHYRPKDSPESLANITVYEVLFDSNRNGYWIAAFEGLYFLNKKTAEVTQMHHNYSPITIINALEFDANGNLWIGAENALYTIGKNNLSVGEVRPLNDSISEIVDFRLQSDGQMWAISWAKGAYIFEKDGQFIKNLGEQDGVPSARLIDGIVIKDQVIVASWKGISIFNKKFQLSETLRYHGDENKVHSMSNFRSENEHKLLFDYELGVQQFDVDTKQFKKINTIEKNEISTKRYGLGLNIDGVIFKLDKNFAIPARAIVNSGVWPIR